MMVLVDWAVVFGDEEAPSSFVFCFVVCLGLVGLVVFLVFPVCLVKKVVKHLTLAARAFEAEHSHLVLVVLGILCLHDGGECCVADGAVSAGQAM